MNCKKTNHIKILNLNPSGSEILTVATLRRVKFNKEIHFQKKLIEKITNNEITLST